MTPQRRAKIFGDHDGRCYVCTRRLTARDHWDIDHVLALERGGTDDDSNLAPICEHCHSIKTGEDHAAGGHIRRTYTKHVVPSAFRRSKAWRR
jgi:5-methylcytosine-specific restriction endonuclease McrA